ncbi:MAG: hypothetical protein Q9217_006681 [Psora testacea]
MAVEKKSLQEGTENDTTLYQRTFIVLAAFVKLLECNQTASINKGFHAVVDLIQSCLDIEYPGIGGTLMEQAALQSMLKRAEYLPVKDAAKWHLPGIQGLLDQQFRLLREDTVGQLRDCVRTVMEDLGNRNSRRSSKNDALQGLRVYKYSRVSFSELMYDKRRRKLLVMAHFDQPETLANCSTNERRRWWDDGKQMQIDSLVCLVDLDGNNLFFSVAERGGSQKSKIHIILANSFEIVVSDRDKEEINHRGLADLGSNTSTTHKAILTQTLRITTVDNFQGEESNVVIVSLVRSNKERQCGFLRSSNRINVLLSRAKYGMFIIGKADTSSRIPMWAQVIDILQKSGNMGTSLPLCCPQHPDTVVDVRMPEDFLRWTVAMLAHSNVTQNRATMPSSVSTLVSDGTWNVITPGRSIVVLIICAAPNIKGAMADVIMGLTYADINLDENPCIVPDCGHVMSIQSMDGLINLAPHYKISKDSLPEAPLSLTPDPLSAPIKECPMCRGSLRSTHRYNRVVKRALLDESTKKFISWSNARFVPLTIALQHEEEALNDTQEIIMSTDKKDPGPLPALAIADRRHSQIAKIRTLSGLGHRLGHLLALRRQISNYLYNVRHEEQPFVRVGAMTAEVVRRTGQTPTFSFDMSVLQTRAQLLALSLQIRCDYDILSDFLNVYKKHKPRMAHMHS